MHEFVVVLVNLGILIQVYIWSPSSYLCYTASIWFSSATLSNVLDVCVAFQCRFGRSDQELWKSRSLEQSAPNPHFGSYLTLSGCPPIPHPFPWSPFPLCRFLRYHYYIHMLGNTPFLSHPECFLSTPQWLCCLPGVWMVCLYSTIYYISLHGAGRRVWLHDNVGVCVQEVEMMMMMMMLIMSLTNMIALPTVFYTVIFLVAWKCLCFFHLTTIHIGGRRVVDWITLCYEEPSILSIMASFVVMDDHRQVSTLSNLLTLFV